MRESKLWWRNFKQNRKNEKHNLILKDKAEKQTDRLREMLQKPRELQARMHDLTLTLMGIFANFQKLREFFFNRYYLLNYAYHRMNYSAFERSDTGLLF